MTVELVVDNSKSGGQPTLGMEMPFAKIRGELMTMGHGGRILIGDYCYVGDLTRIWSGPGWPRALAGPAATYLRSESYPQLDKMAKAQSTMPKLVIDIAERTIQKRANERTDGSNSLS